MNIRIREKQGNVKSIFPNSVALKGFKQNQETPSHLFFQYIDLNEDETMSSIINLLLEELSIIKNKE